MELSLQITESRPSTFKYLMSSIRMMCRTMMVQATGITSNASLEFEFSRVLSRNNSLINRVCFYYATSQEEYEDLRQDVLINLWRGMERFRNEAKESTWIYRVCLNTCVSTWRKNKRHAGHLPMDMITEKAADECNSKDAEMQLLHELITRLNPVEKALIMMWLDEKSYDEIAGISGFNRNTVATKLRRIREKLTKWANQ